MLACSFFGSFWLCGCDGSSCVAASQFGAGVRCWHLGLVLPLSLSARAACCCREKTSYFDTCRAPALALCFLYVAQTLYGFILINGTGERFLLI